MKCWVGVRGHPAQCLAHGNNYSKAEFVQVNLTSIDSLLDNGIYQGT